MSSREGESPANFERFAFSADICKGIKAAGYTVPTPIQQEAIPPALKGRDVLGIAQTGTGKTAAFVLPILQRLTAVRGRGVRALIITPTRELAEQICMMCTALAKATGLRSISIYGGVSKGPQLKAIRGGAEIVAACPGRLLDHINDRAIDLSQIEVLVLDEADRMCDMGFLPDIRRIIKRLPKQRQTLFFCATMPNDIRTISDRILRDPVTVQIGTVAPASTVSHAIYPVEQHLKTKLLLEIMKQTSTGRVLIFARTKRRTETLARKLKKQKMRVAGLHGDMSQNKRQEAIDGFRGNRYDVLVATDVAARGIDVTEISHVINFDMPSTVDDYIHRIGRTGRSEETGDAYSFMLDKDKQVVRGVEKILGEKIERRHLPDFDYDSSPPKRGTPHPARSSPRSHKPAGTRTSGKAGTRADSKDSTDDARRRPKKRKTTSRQKRKKRRESSFRGRHI